MEIKILQVFFDSNGLPYKDKERTIHFPIIGSGFQGASNTTKIRFYYGELGDSATSWVATSKLPNGKIGSKVLSTYLDSDLDESYALLELSSFYFQYKGDVFISLQGYDGGVQVEYDSETGLYVIHGTPTIQATGSIKLSVNYATQFVGSGEESNADLQSMLALLGEKANDDDVVHKAGAETISGAKTFTNNNSFSGNNMFSGTTTFTGKISVDGFTGHGEINLTYTYLTTDSKTYFARVGITSNQYIYYDLPKNYNDLLSEQHLTIATEDYVDSAITSYLGSVIKLQPSKTVAQLNSLTLDSSMVGYVYNVTTSGTLTAGNVDVVAGDNVIVIYENGSYIFDRFATSVDLTDYYNKTEIDSLLSGKVTYTGEVGSKTIAEFFTQYGAGVCAIQVAGVRWLLSAKVAVVGETNTQLTVFAVSLEGNFEIARSDYYQSFANSTTMYSLITSLTKKQPLTCQEFGSSSLVIASLEGDKPHFFKISGDSYNYIYIGSVSKYTISQEQGQFSWQIEVECLNDARRWVHSVSGTYYPSLTFAQLMTNTYLKPYENTENKVTSLSGSSTDTQYPSAKCVYDNLQDIREVAEGKCQSLTVEGNAPAITSSNFETGYYKKADGSNFEDFADFLDYVNAYYEYDLHLLNGDLLNQNDAIELNTSSGCYFLEPIGGGDIYRVIPVSYFRDNYKTGDVIWVTETNYPDRWLNKTSGDLILYKLETALANYVTTNTTQVITGTKTFAGDSTLLPGAYFRYSGIDFSPTVSFVSTAKFFYEVVPASNNSVDLGSSSYTWKDIYLSGSVKIGNYGSLLLNETNFQIQAEQILLLYSKSHVIRDVNDNATNLGASGFRWKDLYLSGNLSNGTESYNIQDSYNLLFGKYTENNAMTELDYTQYCIIQLSADRTFTLKSANYGCFPEYHFKVENTSASAVTLTFPNNTVILTNDEDNVVVSSNTISLAGNTTIECSLVGLNLVAINFEVQ